jgi:two-component system phosphate regulon sensor histidine kinase PhoR
MNGREYSEKNNRLINNRKQKSEDKASEVKERLFDLFIHDLTLPLSVVSTSTASLLHKTDQHGPLSDHQKRIVERILRNARKAQTLLQEIIEVFRSEEGIFQREAFSIEESLRESIIDALEITAPQIVEKLCCAKGQEEIQSILKPQGIHIEIKGKYCQTPFSHDQKKVQQILRNLITNALKYRREKIAMTISGETDLIVLVEDDGRGIPLDKQETIFERFVRLTDKKQPDVQGLGLGLTGVKTLVEAMGGEITVVSQEGLGAQFTVRIPPLP